MSLTKNKLQFASDFSLPAEKAAFVIIPIPYEKTTSYGKGAKNGPLAILKASQQIELWDEELEIETYKSGFFTSTPISFTNSEKDFFSKIEKKVSEILKEINGIPIFLGGEHSITQGLIPPFEKIYKNLSVFHFDAHADLRETYLGTEHSHACALYPASRNTKIVQVGIRSIGLEEKKFVNSGNVKTFLMHENLDVDKLIPKVLKELTDVVYMTIDIDGFDPSVMPATGTPQPGGFMWYEALKLFKAICHNKKIVGLDVVELAPQKYSNITELNVAKLIYRLMGYILTSKKIRTKIRG